MGQWNQNQWQSPVPYANATANLLASAYCPGDQSAATLPGFTLGVKNEDGADAGVAKISDFIENYAQTGLPMISTIDGLPIGALHWDDATVPASSYTSILMHYAFEIVGGVATLPGVAGEYKLSQNYPNPFNPTTTIRYGLPHRSHVVLAVFNTLGQEVAVLQTGDQEAGYHEAKFDGTNCASGVYFYRIQAGSFVQTKRLLLLR